MTLLEPMGLGHGAHTTTAVYSGDRSPVTCTSVASTKTTALGSTTTTLTTSVNPVVSGRLRDAHDDHLPAQFQQHVPITLTDPVKLRPNAVDLAPLSW